MNPKFQRKITDYIEKEQLLDRESDLAADDDDRLLDLFDSDGSVAINDKHRSTK